MAADQSGYDYEEDPVMWDSLENNFADLNDTPDYEALSDLPQRRKSNFGRFSEEFTFPAPGEEAHFSPSPLMARPDYHGAGNVGHSDTQPANHEQLSLAILATCFSTTAILACVLRTIMRHLSSVILTQIWEMSGV